MQNREQAIGYIIYALLKWGVSVVEIKSVVENLLKDIPENAVIDNYTNTRYLKDYTSKIVHHYAPFHFDDDNEFRDISSMIHWAYDDYTVQAAGEMFKNFNQLINGSMRFDRYY